MIAEHDHAVAGKKLGALAIGSKEGTLVAFEPFRSVNGHTFARHQLRQRVNLAFDPLGAFGIDVDQSTACMPATEGVTRRDQPTLRVFVEDDEILSRRDADDDFAKLAPLVVGAEAHG